MKHLLDNWDEVREVFMTPLFLMTDYDGTLTPIVDDPEEANISPNMKERLEKLTRFCPIGIISGRSLSDLKSRAGIDKAYYSGNHGYEISGPDIDYVKEEAKQSKEIIGEICDKVRSRIKEVEGAMVENKKYTASFHYRKVADKEEQRIKNQIENVISPFEEQNQINVNYGKKVIEINPPNDWNKGDAVNLLRQVTNLEESFPIYIGDDMTDEHAFYSLEETGVGILVSKEERESGADYRLSNTNEVGIFFERLLELFKTI